MKLVFLLLFTASFCSCTKELGDCFTPAGSKKTEERRIEDFSSIRLENNINLTLKKDSFCHARIECGSNLIGDIHTDVTNGRLKIWNSNSCNWVRNLSSRINMLLYYKTLDELNYNATGDVTTLDTLFAGHFALELKDGAGNFKLLVNIDTANFNVYDGTSDVSLSGKVKAQYIYYSGYGKFDASGLGSGFTYIHNRGTNDCYVTVADELQARIESFGNIYYRGNPANIITWISGEGKLIHISP